ncbi:hypothetical protein GFL18_00870 [Rhizobium leguminosarum bv. viciae]|nr:hypothetical protein [Rhizobium leguminosarum bv. viciae]
MATACSLIPVPSGLCPSEVTGIQPRRVCAVIDPYSVKESSAPKDLGALDSCNKHRNEGRGSADSAPMLHGPSAGAWFG